SYMPFTARAKDPAETLEGLEVAAAGSGEKLAPWLARRYELITLPVALVAAPRLTSGKDEMVRWLVELPTGSSGSSAWSSLAVVIAATRVGFGFERGLTVRVANGGSFAIGPDGLQGGIMAAMAGGFRIPIAAAHGPFVRAGAEGAFFGNRRFWSSKLEIPQLQ